MNTDKDGRVLSKKDQCGTNLDHAVLLVGYGTLDGDIAKTLLRVKYIPSYQLFTSTCCDIFEIYEQV